MARIDLIENMGQWRALVNIVLNLLIPKMLGNSSVAERRAASQEWPSAKELIICLIPLIFPL
jgi:hypothetical protein